MIEDTILTQFCVAPIDPEIAVSSEADETAYALQSIRHGRFSSTKEEEEALNAAPVSDSTLGYELEMEIDLYPGILTTFTADKHVNAKFDWGGHAPGERNFQESCRFKSEEKVLCLMYEGLDAVFPAIVVGPITEQYLRELYERDKAFQMGHDSADEAVAAWCDWDWDSIIVRPLVRLRNCWGEEMGQTVLVHRVYSFPYKKFEV